MNCFVAFALSQLAIQTRNRCFVADVPDSVWTDVAASVHKRQLNLDAVSALMREWSVFERVLDQEGVLWRARESLDGLSNLADRRALGSFGGRPNLGFLGEWVLRFTTDPLACRRFREGIEELSAA
jgi:hypothetical protein